MAKEETIKPNHIQMQKEHLYSLGYTPCEFKNEKEMLTQYLNYRWYPVVSFDYTDDGKYYIMSNIIWEDEQYVDIISIIYNRSSRKLKAKTNPNVKKEKIIRALETTLNYYKNKQ